MIVVPVQQCMWFNRVWFKEVSRFKYLGVTSLKNDSPTRDIYIMIVTAAP